MNFKQRRDRAHAQRMFLRHMPRMLKKTYAGVIEEMIRDSAIFGSSMMKVEWDKSWNQPIILGVEHGVVFDKLEED